jgi:glycosyltransferase involved in cell wall biosynthesis
MKERICFFSRGFAFNRLNRLKYFEKIFPKNIKMFLVTTNKFKNNSSKSEEWDLKRIKVHYIAHNPLRIAVSLRKFCKTNEITTIVNMGTFNSAYLFLFSTIFSKTNYLLNVMNVLRNKNKSKLIELKNFITLWPLIFLSKKTSFADKYDSKRVKKLFFNSKDIKFIPAPTDTSIFKRKNQKSIRRKLGLPKNKKIVIFVGRLNYAKGTDIFMELVTRNKEILFIAVGKIIYEPLKDFKAKNLIHYPSKTSEELVDLYNSADLGFFLQRFYGAGLGQTTQEALACGIPSINRDWPGLKKSPALFLIPINTDCADKTLKSFFKKRKRDKERLSSEAKNFAIKNYSGNVLKKKYVNYYLN